MRNILISLTLCVLTLTTSSVFAEGYDASRRTERLGLSFYDGRPLYIIRFACDVVDRKLTRADLIRVHTGSNLTDYGVPNGSGVVVDYVRNDAGKMYEYGYSFYGVDENGDLIPLHSATFGYPYYQEMLDSLIMRLSPDDVAVDIFDALLKPLQEWLGGALGFWLAIGVVFLGWQYLRRLVRGGVAIGGKSAEVEASNDDFLEGFRRRRAEKLAAEQEREKFESFQKAWGAIRELGEADAYATGEAFGLTFTDKVVKSNLILQEAWSRLSEDERRFLANEARALAWQDDFIGEKEKIYRQAVMETALGDLDGVDASSVLSNPFEDATYYDDDNGGTPF